MDRSKHVRPRSAQDISLSNAEPNPTLVLPFGQNGAGLLTGHPIGLVIVLGLILFGLVGMPEARWFFAGSLVLGGGFGLILWLHHR
jgi:hypothetical protein